MAELKVTVTARNDSLGPKVLEVVDRQKLRIGLAIAGYRATGKVTKAIQVGSDFKAEVGKNEKGEEIVRVFTLIEGKSSIIDIPLNIVDKRINTSSAFSGYKPMVESV